MNEFEELLPQGVYDCAEEITLSDLLALPATRHWAISMVSNICNAGLEHPAKYSKPERLMMFDIMSVNSQLPQDIRMAAFEECGKAQHRRREARRNQDE